MHALHNCQCINQYCFFNLAILAFSCNTSLPFLLYLMVKVFVLEWCWSGGGVVASGHEVASYKRLPCYFSPESDAKVNYFTWHVHFMRILLCACLLSIMMLTE